MTGNDEAGRTARTGHESLGGVGAALWRRKALILIPTLLAFVGALAFVNFVRPRYASETRMLLENRDTPYSRADRDIRAQDPAIDAEAVASQVQNIMSREIALRIVRELGLADNPEFNTLLRGMGISARVLSLVGLGPDPNQTPEDRAADTFAKRLLVFPQGKSRVISIEFQSEDPKLAAEIANRIALIYLQREEGAKTDTSRSSSEWLDRTIEPLVKKVQGAEAKVEAFRASKGLFLGSGGSTLSTQQLAELNSQLTNARTQQADLAARARLIREAVRLGRIFETSEINNNELVRRLLEQRAGMKAQIALEERTLLPGHPRMRELSAQLADLEGQIRAAADRAARALENDARIAGARVASMQAEIDTQKKSAALSNEDEVQLKALERDAASLRDQLNSYRSKFLDAAARAGENAQLADARIISKAFAASEPTFPKKVPVVLLVTLGTFALASTLVATNALMARAAAAPEALPAGYIDPYGYGPVPSAPPPAGPPPAGPPPAGPPAPRETPPEPAPPEPPARGGIFPFPFGARASAPAPAVAAAPPPRAPDLLEVAESGWQPAEDLARELAMMDLHGPGKVIMLLGVGAEARLSLAALRCARRLARDGAAVVLDLVGQGADRQGANLYARLLPAGSAGLNAYLDRTAGLGAVIHRDPRTPLHVIPAGGAAHHRLASAPVREQVSGLIDALARSYSHVLVDGGAMGGSGDLFAHLADVVVLLARPGEDEAFITRAVEKFEALRDAPVFVIQEGESVVAAPAAGVPALAAFARG